MINKKRLLNSFIKYVKVSSPSKNERAFLSLIKKELSSLGLLTQEDNAGSHIEGNSGNIHSFMKGNVKGAPRILLNAHLDTVTHPKKIEPKIKNGIVYSGGDTILGADNKAGVAAIMEVIRVLKSNKLPHGDIDIVFSVAEEIGLCGSKFIDKKFLKADMGFVLDGGDADVIINKAPSQDSIEATIIGRAAHAGVHPEDGINAIKAASTGIARMKLGRIDFETTANIGLINGGVATNIVPESVTIRGEARSHNRDKLRRQVVHMHKELHAGCVKAGAKLFFNVKPAYRSFEVQVGHPMLELAIKAAIASGIKPKVKATGGGSDANIFSAMGLPCLILGVGADNVHTNRENVSVNDMAKGAELVMNIIKESLKCSKKQ